MIERRRTTYRATARRKELLSAETDPREPPPAAEPDAAEDLRGDYHRIPRITLAAGYVYAPQTGILYLDGEERRT